MRQGSGRAAIGKTAGALAGLLLALVQPARAADELPYVPMPEVEVDIGRIDIAPVVPVYPGPRGAYAAIPPARYGGMIERPTVPPHQVVAMLRNTGFSMLGRIERRGWIYTVAVLNPNGDDGRAIIDARTGAIIRFIPAQAVTARLNDELTTVYGPPGPPPLASDLRHARRPPLGVPKVAGRSPAIAPLPRPRTAGPAQQIAKPLARHAAMKPKTAVPAPDVNTSAPAAAPAVAAQPAARPAEIELKPTQEMPPVQTLE